MTKERTGMRGFDCADRLHQNAYAFWLLSSPWSPVLEAVRDDHAPAARRARRRVLYVSRWMSRERLAWSDSLSAFKASARCASGATPRGPTSTIRSASLAILRT